ncbi:MOSC domain-containing protein [Sphingomonas gilva]|uniref:MOSC domain-containing protein n=2 Tax=Sphingomonas gilva TaxID=2305907 RepID=A0A396RQ01_9SPHN|nr:MOSC domain-containing protein [Sphingomonas gilva]
MMTGRLAGIARHARSRGPIEVIDHVSVSLKGGLAGDFRGAVRPGGKGKRQVSLIEAGDWAAAMAELGADLHWSVRRANLLVEGLDLPQTAGAVLAIGRDVRLEITVECDPCSRMEEIAPGLKAVLTPDWRGGALARVLSGGDIAVGDEIRIEE